MHHGIMGLLICSMGSPVMALATQRSMATGRGHAYGKTDGDQDTEMD